MTQEIQSVIVLGAGGNIGVPVLDALQDSKNFKISVLTRHSSTTKFPSHVTVHKTDYSESSLLDAFKGQDAVISTIGSMALTDQIKIIDAAVKAGVKRFIPSEFGGNNRNQRAVDMVPIFKDKREVLQYLSTKAKENKTFSYTAIATGPFFDWGLRVGFLGFDINSESVTIYGDGTKKLSMTTLSTSALSVVKVLLNPTETANQHVFVQSFLASQNEVLAVLEEVGGKKWKVTKADIEETAKVGHEMLAKGDGLGIVPVLRVISYGEGYGSNWEEDETLWNKKLGLPEQENLRAIVKAEYENKQS
ncbi:MAG: hypothetical protein M1827_002755 [Pycnora praestabilis]|nr:MAG: hypothetical protein M1827_002755 [Pycnora praestabilis]